MVKYYGLYHDGELLRFYTLSNGDAEEADEYCEVFDKNSDHVFLITDKTLAERYSEKGNFWYNGWVQPYENVEVREVTLNF